MTSTRIEAAPSAPSTDSHVGPCELTLDRGTPRTLLALPGRVASWLMILIVRGYQLFISPLIGARCRYHPTCSAYFVESVRKYGAIRGGWRGVKRIGRCHPFREGGYDPP